MENATHRRWRGAVCAGITALPKFAQLLMLVWLVLFGRMAYALAEFAVEHQDDRPGFVYAAARDGALVASGAYGLASVELGVPLQIDSVLNAGSVAKTVTAWAILALEADGLLNLDDEIHQYLPELPDYGAPIPLRKLLNHTAGLKDYWALSSLTGQHAADVRTQAQALALIQRQPTLNFAPGSHHLYSNSGYILLAELVGRRTGEPFARWVAQNAFAPLGMANSRMLDDPLAIVPNYAPSYRTSAAGLALRQEPLPSGVVGSGNLLTTAPELARWGTFLMTAKVGGRPLLERMMELPALPDGGAEHYGLGLSLGAYRGHPVAHHGGANAGYRSHLLLFPDQNLAIAVLANGSALQAARLAERVADHVLDLPPEEPPLAPELAAPFPVDHAGLYALATGLLLNIQVLEDGAVARVMGVPYPLRAVAAGTFQFGDGDDRLMFEPERNGGPPRLTLTAGGTTTDGWRETPLSLSAREARRYVGTYESAALDARYRVSTADDGLRLTFPGGLEIPLTRLREDLFLHWELADLLIQFERDRRQRVQGFSLSVNRAHHIEFRRAAR